MFNSKELATIMVGLNFVKSQVDQQMVQDATGVELKIKNVLPNELKTLMTSLEEHTIVDPYLRFNSNQKKGGDWYLISAAIADKKRMQFTYTTKAGSRTTRKIDPYLLVYFQDHWNVVGWSHRRGDIRSFILDRIVSPVILEENWLPKPKMSVDSLIFRYNELKKIVVLDVEKSEIERIRAILPAKIIRLEQKKPKKIRLSFEFDNMPFLNHWLLQFGTTVKIIKPEILISLQKQTLQAMINDLEK